MKLTLHIWRQKDAKSPGRMVQYEATEVEPDMSFLEMLDVLNEKLISQALVLTGVQGLNSSKERAGARDAAVRSTQGG